MKILWVPVGKLITAQYVKDNILLQPGVRYAAGKSFERICNSVVAQNSYMYGSARFLKLDVSG